MIKADEMLKISKKAREKAKKEEDKIVESELKKMDAIKDKILYEIEKRVRKEACAGFTQTSIILSKIPTLENYIKNSKIIIKLITQKLRFWLREEGYVVVFTFRPYETIQEISIYWGEEH